MSLNKKRPLPSLPFKPFFLVLGIILAIPGPYFLAITNKLLRSLGFYIFALAPAFTSFYSNISRNSNLSCASTKPALEYSKATTNTDKGSKTRFISWCSKEQGLKWEVDNMQMKRRIGKV
jgi:hypothetical protein